WGVFLCCISLGVQVRQSPSAAIRNAGDDVQLICTHEKTDYRVMLWYQQSPGDTALKLIGYVDYSTIKYEGDFEKYSPFEKRKYTMSRPSLLNSTLYIYPVEPEDTALYYCASSRTQWFRKNEELNNNLGGGKKITT
uniref:Ig-like domain-containing protein n=1 Tax=Maylandia zebra TaxID=106582 RepID=A0A3P9BZ28_9CICH